MAKYSNTNRARKLRQQQTTAEGILWEVLRGNRLCNLKFRRQFPIGPFFADFACVKERLVVEIDGGYHDYQYADDVSRQKLLETQGWTILRFANEDVLQDAEAVARAIANRLGVEFRYERREGIRPSGMFFDRKEEP